MDRNAWTALVLIVGILFLSMYWEQFFGSPKPVTPQKPITTQSAPKADSGKAATLAPADSSVKTASAVPIAESIPWHHRTSDLGKGRTVVETPLYTAILAWDGARFVSWKLAPNGKYLKEPVEIVRKEGYSIAPGIVLRDGGIRTVEHLVFTSPDSFIKVGDGESKPVTLRAQFDPFGPVELVYVFHGGNFVMDVTARLTGASDNGVWTISPGINPTEDIRGSLISKMIQTGEESFIGSYAWLGNSSKGDVEEFSPGVEKVEKFDASGTTQWVAQRSKYFVLSLQPQKAATSVQMLSDIGLQKTWKTQRVILNVPSSGDAGVFQTRVYFGPLKNDLIKAFDPNLESIMNWGWSIIKPFSKSTLWLLTFFYKFIPNYGLVILIFTIIVKIVLWPLTIKQFRSMKEMQVVQPLMQELREKYKDNPKKLQEEMFKLYAEYKINPAAGCLPMLLQMPVMYALFIVFRSTIELRDAPFMLWITDLSQAEILFHLPFSIPIYGSTVALLPILMGITQFFMGKQTASPDPNQKVMLYIMPIMMAVFFNNLPAGLVLYYTFYNLTTIVQTHYIKGTTDKKVPLIKQA